MTTDIESPAPFLHWEGGGLPMLIWPECARRGVDAYGSSDPADVRAGIGPAIHPDRYQVGADVVEAAEEAFGDRTADVVRADDDGRWTFDRRMREVGK